MKRERERERNGRVYEERGDECYIEKLQDSKSYKGPTIERPLDFVGQNIFVNKILRSPSLWFLLSLLYFIFLINSFFFVGYNKK